VLQVLRPLSIGELLDRTFYFYRRNFLLFVGISALPGLLGLAYQLVGVFLRRDVTSNLTAAGPLFMLAWMIGSMFVYLLTTTLAHGATVVAVSQMELDRPTSVAAAFGAIQGRLGRLVLIILNVGIRVVLGSICFIIPGILLALKYAVTIPAAVVEDTGVSESLARSAHLTKGHRGRILLIYFLLAILILIGGMLWQVPTMAIIAAVSGTLRPGQVPDWAQVLLEFGGFVTQSVLGPILTIGLTLVYYDERVRKEAFDLEHMMRQLDGMGPAPSPVA
jgi:hypothetical protein